MDDNRIEGTARNLGGKIEEGLGRATGDVRSQAEGKMNQVAGAAQELYGQARETAGDAAAMVGRQAVVVPATALIARRKWPSLTCLLRLSRAGRGAAGGAS